MIDDPQPPAPDDASTDEHARLVEANSLFQAIYDQGLFAGRIDLDGVLIDANRSSLEQCGYTREDVVGKPFWECGWWNRSPDVQAWVRRAVEQALAGEPFRGISPYFRADGTERVVDFACMPIRGADGRVHLVVPTGMDITERVAATRDLRAVDILESITDGFFGVDRDWRFTYLNGEAQRILGRSRDDLVGKGLWDEYPQLAGTEFERVYRAAMERGEAESVVSYYADHERWYEVHPYPAADGISVYFRNVTAYKRAEAERNALMAASENQRRMYEAALANTPDLVYVFDLGHRFIYANEALLAMWGRTRDEALGRTCLELGYEPWHAAMHDREIEQVVATKRPIRGEVPFTGTNGRRIYDYIFVPVLGASGEVVAVAGTTRDVTERQQAEQAIREQAERLRAQDRAKDEFLATLSHELRNPLAPLRNALALLRLAGRGDAPAAPTAEVVAMMERQVEHLVRLVDDLLEVSRITRGTLALRRARVPLAAIVRNAVETSAPLVEAGGHRLDVRVPDEPIWLDGDDVRLAQIVANLLNNAAKYTPRGGRIALAARRDGDAVVVDVTDDGAGIAAEELPQLFTMFRRGAWARTNAPGGLGIGLALSRRLAAMHGGSIEARSDGPGRGSTFTVRLPAAAPPPDAPGATPAGGAMAGRRILVVDDNRDAAESLAIVLRHLGAQVRVAHDGTAALAAVDDHAPSVVLLDIGMPGMDGYEVARRLRSASAQPPLLVALTGWGQDDDRRRAYEAGFDHHLVKPADIGRLQQLLSAPDAAPR